MWGWFSTYLIRKKSRILPLRAKRNCFWQQLETMSVVTLQLLLTSSGYVQGYRIHIFSARYCLPPQRVIQPSLSTKAETLTSTHLLEELLEQCLFWNLKSSYLLLKFVSQADFDQLPRFTFHFPFSLVAGFYMFIRRNSKDNTLLICPRTHSIQKSVKKQKKDW